ncbi:hypothetical protein [Stenotrophomonas maltophilia]|uniref:hypothetical protein n=1 Tax=Stenotrophomonas maltophilia TaxID=40324 RepID=UPI0039C234D0
MILDRFNPRVWLRNWLLKPTAAEASIGQELPNRVTLTAERFAVVNTHAQGQPVAHPFECADAQVSLGMALAEKIDKAIGQWADREQRPGGVLYGRCPEASWKLMKDGSLKIQGMGPNEGPTSEPV